MKAFDYLLGNCTEKYQIAQNPSFVPAIMKNNEFIEFTQITDGGFFFEGSLHIYGFEKEVPLHSMEFINQLIKNEYKGLLDDNIIFFGCDVFGNQFGFSEKEVVFLEIETGESKVIGKSFIEGIEKIEKELDYYTGLTLLREWSKRGTILAKTERLVPIKPFVVGGKYEVSNLYSLDFAKAIRYNANIARQIKDLPDGQAINIVTVE